MRKVSGAGYQLWDAILLGTSNFFFFLYPSRICWEKNVITIPGVCELGREKF